MYYKFIKCYNFNGNKAEKKLILDKNSPNEKCCRMRTVALGAK